MSWLLEIKVPDKSVQLNTYGLVPPLIIKLILASLEEEQ